MQIPSYAKIIIQYQVEINAMLHEFVYSGYNAMCHYVHTPLKLCILLYIILLGFGIMYGTIRMPFVTVIKAAVKLGVIYTFIMNWGNFSNTVIELFQKSSGAVGAALLDVTPISLPHFAGEGTTGALQSVLVEVAAVGDLLFSRGSIYHLGALLDGIFIWLSGFAMVALAFVEITIANVLLSILFVAAPLFIIFTLFKTTQGFFDRWLGTLAGCSFVLIFINIIISLNMSILQEVVGYYYENGIDSMHVISFVPFVIISVIAIIMLRRTTLLAMNIGGVLSSLAVSDAIGPMLGVLLVPALQGLKQAGSRLTPNISISSKADSNSNNKVNINSAASTTMWVLYQDIHRGEINGK